jgi:hypothetical protein
LVQTRCLLQVGPSTRNQDETRTETLKCSRFQLPPKKKIYVESFHQKRRISWMDGEETTGIRIETPLWDPFWSISHYEIIMDLQAPAYRSNWIYQHFNGENIQKTESS